MKYQDAIEVMNTHGPKCTMCGKALDEIDLMGDYHFVRDVGFGSKYDLTRLEARLCCGCFDKTVDWVAAHSAVHPVVKEYD